MRRVSVHLGDEWTPVNKDAWVRTPPNTPQSHDALSRPQDHLNQFAAITLNDTHVELSTDHMRSWPIFYRVADDAIKVADRIETLTEGSGVPELSESSVLEFQHAGFVTGRDTLFSGIHQVPAGVTAVIDRKTGALTEEWHRDFQFEPRGESSPSAFQESFEAAFSASMETLFQRADGRRLVVPLSAGADSRLIATWISRSAYPNVLAFTYGDPRSREVQLSRAVAGALGVQWSVVPYDRATIARAWQQSANETFLRDTWSGSALPHIQDWFAIRHLTETGAVDPGDIVLPGHAMVGAMFDGDLRSRSDVSVGDVVKTIAERHYSLLNHPEVPIADPPIRSKMQRFIASSNFTGTPRDVQNATYRFNHLERKVKYINNSVRTYEHFGLDWALPLHDLRMWRQYASGAYNVVSDRGWYSEWVNRLYSEETRQQAPYVGTAAPPRTNSLRQAANRLLRASGILDYYTRARRTRAILEHPLAFDAWATGVPRHLLARRLLAGQNILGTYADLFLKDEWVPGTSLFR